MLSFPPRQRVKRRVLVIGGLVSLSKLFVAFIRFVARNIRKRWFLRSKKLQRQLAALVCAVVREVELIATSHYGACLQN